MQALFRPHEMGAKRTGKTAGCTRFHGLLRVITAVIHTVFHADERRPAALRVYDRSACAAQRHLRFSYKEMPVRCSAATGAAAGAGRERNGAVDGPDRGPQDAVMKVIASVVETAGRAAARWALAAAMLGVGAAGLAMAQAPGAAQGGAGSPAGPGKPVRLVVASAPGTTLDLVARTLAPRFGEALGQPVSVENRPGAYGAAAADAVAKSPLDGSTLLLTTPSFAALVALSAKLPFDGAGAFAPVGRVATEPLVLVVTGTMGLTSLLDLIAIAKASPGQVNYVSTGVGSGSHLAMELLKSSMTIQLAHVAAADASAAIGDVSAGRAKLFFGNVATVEPAIRSGKVKPLAVAGPATVARLPDVPTIQQAGIVDYDFVSWFGVLAPIGTSKATIERLNADLRKAIAAPDVRDRLAQVLGASPQLSTPDELGARIRREIAVFGKLGRELNIRLD